MANSLTAKIIKPEEVINLRYPLPQSWIEVAGILKKKRVSSLLYQQKIRRVWEKRLKKVKTLYQEWF